MEPRNKERRSSKQKHWQNHIACWQNSGLSRRQYCPARGISTSTFSYWIRKSYKASKQPHPTRFYPLAVQNAITSSDKIKSQAGLRLLLRDDRFKIDLEKDFSEINRFLLSDKGKIDSLSGLCSVIVSFLEPLTKKRADILTVREKINAIQSLP